MKLEWANLRKTDDQILDRHSVHPICWVKQDVLVSASSFHCVSVLASHYIEQSSGVSDTSEQETSHRLTKVRRYWVCSSNFELYTILFKLLLFYHHKYILVLEFYLLKFSRLVISIQTEALKHLLQYLEFTNSLDSRYLKKKKSVLTFMCDQLMKTYSLIIWICPDQEQWNQWNLKENWTRLYLIGLTLASRLVLWCISDMIFCHFSAFHTKIIPILHLL